MRREEIRTAKTVEEAIEAGCDALACERQDCEWEIIDLPRKGFLGLINTPAKVRVYIDDPELPPLAPASPPPPRAAAPAAPQQPKAATPPPAPVREQRPQRAAAPKADVQPEKRVPPAKPAPTQANVPSPKAPPANVPPLKREPREPVPEKILTPEEEQLIEQKTAAGCEYLSQVLLQMGVEAKLAAKREHGGVCINIQGDGLGVMIGRRGDTLDAIQYLVGLVANRAGGDYMRVTLDCGDYRMKRRDTLEVLARKVASQVLKTNTSRTLEPMNPFERRIIHATVSEIAGVVSTSTGEEPNRRIVITTPTAKPGGSWSGPRPNGGRGGRDGASDRGGRENSRSPRAPRDNRVRTERTEAARPETSPEVNREATPASGHEAPREVSNDSINREHNRERTENTSREARPDGGRDTGNRRDSRPRRDERGSDDRGPRRERPAVVTQQQGPPKVTPEAAAAADKPLYGKIDIE